MSGPAVDLNKSDKIRIPDFLKLIEELRALKNRQMNQESVRLEEQHQLALRKASKDSRFVNAQTERDRELLSSKYQKLEGNLHALSRYLKELEPKKELEARLAAQEEKLRKTEEELTIQRKVLTHEQEELERGKQLMKAAEESVTARNRELQGKLQNLDVVKRAAELNKLQEDLDGKLKAYDDEMGTMARQRDELNKDFDNLGVKRADLDREAEDLQKQHDKLAVEKARMADVVAQEMAATFGAFVRDMLKNPEPAPEPEPEASEEKKPESEGGWL